MLSSCAAYAHALFRAGAAGIAARTRGRVLRCVTRQDLFAPPLAQAGLSPDQVIYVEAGDEKAVPACFEEALRHSKSLVQSWRKLPVVPG